MGSSISGIQVTFELCVGHGKCMYELNENDPHEARSYEGRVKVV